MISNSILSCSTRRLNLACAFAMSPGRRQTFTNSRSVNKRERYVKKFGAERAPMMQKMMIERGKENGINLQVAIQP